LRRLGTDYIDLYQIHYRDGKTPLPEVMGTLEELQQEGKIRYIGISNLTAQDLPELHPFAGKFATLQNQYSLATRDLESDILELSKALHLTPTSWGSLGQGVLTGKYDRNVVFNSDDRRSREIYVNFHGEKLEKNLQIVDVLQQIAIRYNKPVSAVAVRFILDHLPGSVALCGAKRPSQILGTAAALGWQFALEDLQILEQISR
jgi:aryl-alcohol dehydrogenase-like predicted oxidoreductase